jgi:hypothetical protein
MGFYVERTQTQDTSCAHLQMDAPSNVGRVQYSKTFPTERAAEREAQAWRDTENWTATVIEGRAPRKRNDS